MKILEISSDLGAESIVHRISAGSRADRPRELGRAKPMKEAPVHAPVVYYSHCSGVAVRQDTFRAIRRAGNLLKPRRNFIEGFIPGYSPKTSLTFFPDATHRIENSIRVVNALKVARDFGAQKSLGRRMLRIT